MRSNRRIAGLVLCLLLVGSIIAFPTTPMAETASRIGLPDIIVENVIKMDPIFPKVGDNVTLNATIRNVGDFNATNVTINIEANNDTLPQPIDLGTYHVGPIWGSPNITNDTSNNPVHLIFYWNTSEAGKEVVKDLEYTVTVNATDEFDINLTNGTGSLSFSFLKADEELPYVQNLSVDPTEVIVGENVTVNATFKNIGELPVADEPVFFYLDYNWSGANEDIYNTSVDIEQFNLSATYVEFDWDTSGHAIGNHTITAIIPANGANMTSENITVDPVPPILKPDLTVSDLKIGASSVLQGENTTLTITIKNVGNDTSIDTMVNITDLFSYYTEDFSILAFAPGEEMSYNVTIETGLLSVGIHTFQVWVDRPNLNEEWNETNNSRTLTFKVTSKPDLTVSAPKFYQGSPSNLLTEAFAGENVTIMVTVRNLGLNSSVNQTILSFYLDDVTDLIGNKTLLSYSPSANFNVTMVWNTLGVVPGPHKVLVAIDPNDLNDELNETNNEAEANFTVKKVIQPPDLTIMDLHLSKTEIAAGDTINIDMRVENLGEKDVENAVLRTTLTNQAGATVKQVNETTLPYLAGGSRQFVPLSWNFSEALTEGDYILKVEIDPDDQVAESDELNNVNTTALKVIKKVIPTTDLTVTMIEVAPKKPKKDEKAVITVTVVNKGTKDARDFLVYLYIDDKKVDEANVAFLAKNNGTTAVAFNHTFKDAGGSTIRASVFEGGVSQYSLDQEVTVEEDEGFALGGTTVLLILIVLLVVAIVIVLASGRKKKEPVDEEMEAERRRLYGKDMGEEEDVDEEDTEEE